MHHHSFLHQSYLPTASNFYFPTLRLSINPHLWIYAVWWWCFCWHKVCLRFPHSGTKWQNVRTFFCRFRCCCCCVFFSCGENANSKSHHSARVAHQSNYNWLYLSFALFFFVFIRHRSFSRSVFLFLFFACLHSRLVDHSSTSVVSLNHYNCLHIIIFVCGSHFIFICRIRLIVNLCWWYSNNYYFRIDISFSPYIAVVILMLCEFSWPKINQALF